MALPPLFHQIGEALECHGGSRPVHVMGPQAIRMNPDTLHCRKSREGVEIEPIVVVGKKAHAPLDTTDGASIAENVVCPRFSLGGWSGG
jgi:hypothetical protein